MERSSPGRAILLFMTVLLLLMILIPFVYSHGSFTGLDGRAGVVDNWGKLSFADPLSRGVYSLGDIFCHQETARSFIINGSQTAFCQRDVSVILGVMIGSIVTDEKVSIFPVKNKLMPVIGIVMIASTFIEWGIESVFDIDVLAARIVTGMIAGAGIALLLQHFIIKEYEKVVFGRV